MAKNLYMVVEHFKNGDAAPIYQRFRECGRMLPNGLEYVSSWVDHKLERCYQLMETDNPTLLEKWIECWNDLSDFEVHAVMTSQEAAVKASRLYPD